MSQVVDFDFIANCAILSINVLNPLGDIFLGKKYANRKSTRKSPNNRG